MATFVVAENPLGTNKEVVPAVTGIRFLRSRRSARAASAILIVVAGLVASGVGEANAAQTRYFECPLTVPNAGCGIAGSVGPGKYLAEFTFAGPNGYESEPYVDQCQTRCPVFHWAVGRPDRTPAGFQITSDGPFVLERMLSR